MSKINNINNATGSLTVDPGSSGDSAIQLSINSVAKFKIGIDDDDSDKFKISQGSALGSNDCFVVTTNGEITAPLTSAFSSTCNAWSGENVTGDNTIYTITFATSYFDQSSDFDGTSTFTAPRTGKYIITGSVLLDEASTCTGTTFFITTSNRRYRTGYVNPTNYAQVTGGQGSLSFSVLADMDISDTVTLDVRASGAGSKIVDIGYTNRGTFSAYLVC